MQTYTQEQRAAALAKASETQKWLYSDPANGILLASIAQKHRINEQQYKNFAIYVGELILKLRSTDTLPDAVKEQGFAVPDIESLKKDMQNFLQQTKESPSAQNKNANDDLEQEIAETTESLQQIQSMRTMQTDHQRQTATTAVPKKPATQSVETEQKESPRWGSDS